MTCIKQCSLCTGDPGCTYLPTSQPQFSHILLNLLNFTLHLSGSHYSSSVIPVPWSDGRYLALTQAILVLLTSRADPDF